MITAWEAMTVAAVASRTIGSRAQSGTSRKNGLLMSRRVAEDQRALAEVAEDAGGEDEEQPGAGDRRAAEVAHVGVQRLGAGDRQHDRGQREERDREVADEEVERVGRRERLQDLRVRRRCRVMPARADREEPDDHHRPEQPPDRGGAEPLDRNSTTMIAAVIGTISCSSDGSTTFSPSTADSTEIAGVIMLSPKNSDAPKMPERRRATIFVRRAAGHAPAADQRDQGHDAALAVVVGAHHEQRRT